MRRAFVLFFAAAAVSLAAPPAAFAQNAAPQATISSAPTNQPLVHLVLADAQTLASALRSVSVQAGVAFVAEGKPYRARNSEPPLAPVAAKWPAKGLPLDEAVQKIAGAYDYEAERKADVFRLRKRYTNPDDLPDMTAEELRLSLRDVIRSASGLPAPVADMPSFENKNSPFTEKFYQTLTPAQIKRLAGGIDKYNEFVQVSELNPVQKQMMWDLAISRHIQNAVGEAQRAQDAIRLCDQKTTAFGWADMQSPPPPESNTAGTYRGKKPETQTVRMLCCMVRENGQTALVPFAPDGRMRFRFANRRIGYRTPKEDTDKAAPMPADFDPNHEPLPPPEETGPDTFTLQSLADELGKREPLGDPIKARGFSPHEELAAKTVAVIGISSANADALWRAAGDVYGLHIVRAEQYGPLLALRPRAQVARDLAGLNEAAFAAFPAPLARLYRGALKADEAERMAQPIPAYLQAPDDASSGAQAERLRERSEDAHTMAVIHTPDRLKRAVLHRFRVLLEPLLVQNVDKCVLYSDLNGKAHDLWTLVLFVDCLGNASDLENQALPATITDFDKGYLSSYINDGFGSTEPKLQFMFWSRNNKGYSHTDGGSVFPVPESYPKPAAKSSQ